MARRRSNNTKVQEVIVEQVEQVEAPAVVEVTEVTEVKFPSNEELEAGGFTNISQKMRELNRLGMSIGDIARQLDKRYQHAFNVCKKPLKKVVVSGESEGEVQTAEAE